MSSGVCVTRFVYDGADDLILNYNNKILFTHELLEDFVRQGEHGAITHHGFFKAEIEQWLQTKTERRRGYSGAVEEAVRNAWSDVQQNENPPATDK